MLTAKWRMDWTGLGQGGCGRATWEATALSSPEMARIWTRVETVELEIRKLWRR